MLRIVCLLLSLSSFFCQFSIGQTTHSTYIDSSGDTILHVYDQEERLIEEYINGGIKKKIAYTKSDTLVLGQLMLNVNRCTKPEIIYDLEEGDTMLINFSVAAEIKAINYRPERQEIINFKKCQVEKPVYGKFIQSPEFLEKGQIYVRDCSRKKYLLEQVDFIQGDQGNRLSSIQTCSENWREVIETSGPYKIRMTNFKNRSVCLRVLRIPKPKAIVTNYTRDTFFQVDSLHFTAYDTVLVPVLDKIVELAPLRDIERPSFHIEKLDLSDFKDNSITSFAYWFGVGQGAQKHYLDLALKIPDDWGPPEVSPLLGAYVLDKVAVVPGAAGGNVQIAFTDSLSIKTYNQNARFIESDKLQLSNKFLAKGLKLTTSYLPKNTLILVNKNPINSYQIRVLVIAKKLIPKTLYKIKPRTIISKPRILEDEE